MANEKRREDVRAFLSRPSSNDQAGRRRGGRWPEGRRPDLWPLHMAGTLPPGCAIPGTRGWGMALSACWGAVKTVGLGRAGGEGAPPDAA